jgi:hypothetical protein
MNLTKTFLIRKDEDLSIYLDDLVDWKDFKNYIEKSLQRYNQVIEAGYRKDEIFVKEEFYLREPQSGYSIQSLCIACQIKTPHYSYFIGEQTDISYNQDISSSKYFYFTNISFTKRRNEIGKIIEHQIRRCHHNYRPFENK